MAFDSTASSSSLLKLPSASRFRLELMPLSLTRTLGQPSIEIGDFLSTGTTICRDRNLPRDRLNFHVGNIDASGEYSFGSARHVGFFERARPAH
jgi:hypothetical protein